VDGSTCPTGTVPDDGVTFPEVAVIVSITSEARAVPDWFSTVKVSSPSSPGSIERLSPGGDPFAQVSTRSVDCKAKSVGVGHTGVVHESSQKGSTNNPNEETAIPFPTIMPTTAAARIHQP